MLLPIGHSETGVRRLPWVTFAVMGLCVLVYIASVAHSRTGPTSLDKIEGFVEYFFEHPYLDLTPPQKNFLARILFETGLARDIDAFIEIARESYGEPPPRDPGRLRREAETLESLFREAVAQLDEASDAGLAMSLGLIPDHVSVHGLVTYMFVHAGFWHLFFNMLFLYLAGPFVEDRWGRPVFAAVYLAAGVVAALAYVLRYPESPVPLVGASGAIAGLMGAFLVLFWNTKITFFYWFFFMFVGTFEAPAWLMLPLWFVREALFAQASDVVDPPAAQAAPPFWRTLPGSRSGSRWRWQSSTTASKSVTSIGPSRPRRSPCTTRTKRSTARWTTPHGGESIAPSPAYARYWPAIRTTWMRPRHCGASRPKGGELQRRYPPCSEPSVAPSAWATRTSSSPTGPSSPTKEGRP